MSLKSTIKTEQSFHRLVLELTLDRVDAGVTASTGTAASAQ